MLSNNFNQNQLNFNKDTESEYSCMHSNDNFKNNKSEVYNLNSSKNKNDINQNGEVENQLSHKIEQIQERKDFENKKNNKRNTNNEFVRPAGLSSDRCIRDFMSAKNKKYHWNYNKMDNNYYKNKVYKGPNSEGSLDSDKNSNNRENEFRINNNSPANYIFKSNQILRNENRLRNTRHSDIFGVNNEYNLKRILSNQSKTYSDYTSTSNQSLDNELKLNNNCNTTDNDSIYSNNSIDEIYEESLEKRPKVNKEDLLNNKDEHKLLGVVVLKLSGLKSETCEKDLETLCRCCKLQIISINLDRNIITHTCTGTAKLKLKDPNQDNLSNLQDLLRIQGFKCKL